MSGLGRLTLFPAGCFVWVLGGWGGGLALWGRGSWVVGGWVGVLFQQRGWVSPGQTVSPGGHEVESVHPLVVWHHLPREEPALEACFFSYFPCASHFPWSTIMPRLSFNCCIELATFDHGTPFFPMRFHLATYVPRKDKNTESYAISILL